VLQRSEKARFFTGFKTQIFYRVPLIPATLPMEVVLFALPNSEKTLYFALYDIETGTTVFSRKYGVADVGSSACINQTLYNFYYILKKDRK
jgi:hypothetical protein